LSSRLRNGIIIAVAGILLVVLGIFLLSNLLGPSQAATQVETPEPTITQKVVVTTHDLPLGAILQEGDLRLADVPVGFVPRNAVSDIEQALGRFIKYQMVSGEMLLQHHLADPTNVSHDLAYILSEDHVLMAFPATDLMSRQGLIQRGDIVDIFVSLEVEVEIFESGTFSAVEEEKILALFTFDALQRVSITAMVVEVVTTTQDGTTTSSNTTTGALPAGEGASEEVPPPTNAPTSVEIQAYLLALDPQDALILKYLRDAGGVFDFVVRSPISSIEFALDPVTEEFIRELYGLEILR